MLLLGFQHMFAMFGATVLVPVLTGLPVSTTLLFAGLGTLLFHFLTNGRVPAFLGSSFAFIGGYAAVAALFGNDEAINWIPYAGVGVACAGILYAVLSALFSAFGAKKVMRFFPPIVTGPVIICIGLCLTNSAINNCVNNGWIAVLAIAIVVAEGKKEDREKEGRARAGAMPDAAPLEYSPHASSATRRTRALVGWLYRVGALGLRRPVDLGEVVARARLGAFPSPQI
jgi:xanthine/uracil permease